MTPPISPPESDWYKDAIIYEVRVRSFYDSNGDGMGDLAGLVDKLDYLADLGVTALWLLPVCPSPGRDDGYDIADYTDVHPDLGSLADFEHVIAEAHRRGIRIITELVINHTSDQHPWFQRARRAAPGSPERDFYVWSDTSDRYAEARIIFSDFEPSNWAWDPVAKAYYWHRFYSHQPDLNFENPAVHDAVFEVVDFWLGLGVDGLRLDAVPYLYEQEGTNCENLPATHAFLKKLRAHIDGKFQGRMILAEANQWPEDAAAYFGAGDECHMNFHFPIMPRMFMAVRMEDRLPILDILAQTPEVPPGCQWAMFLRNHDELTLEMVTDEERDYMVRAYATDPQARINLGIRRRLAPLSGNDRRVMELLNVLLFSLPGTPVLYYGDEIGMGDNVYLGDRNGVRTPMQWSPDRNAGFSRANPQRLVLPVVIDPEYHYESLNVEAQQNTPSSLLWWMKRVIALRKRFRAFGRGTIEFLQPDNRRVLAFVRRLDDEVLLVVANLSPLVQFVELDVAGLKGLVPVELFGRTPFPAIGDRPYFLTLEGHGFLWFSIERPPEGARDGRGAPHEPPVLDVRGTWRAAIEGPPTPPVAEPALSRWLAGRKWFEAHGRTVERTTIAQIYPIEGTPFLAVVVDVTFTEGDADSYFVPLGFAVDAHAVELRETSPESVIAIVRVARDGDSLSGVLYDAMVDPVAAVALSDFVRGGGRVRTKNRELVASTTRRLAPSAEPPSGRVTSGGGAEARVLSADGASASAIVQGQVFLKVFRRLEAGINPDLEVGRFLCERAGLATIPAVLGAIELVGRRGDRATAAILEAHVPNEGTAFQHALSELHRYYEGILTTRRDETPPALPTATAAALAVSDEGIRAHEELLGPYCESAVLLGRRAAELHSALASDAGDPLFAPEGHTALDQRSVYQTMRNQVGRLVRELRAALPRLPDGSRAAAARLVEREAELLRRFEPLRTERILAARTRIHGDLHLDQILNTGKDFVIVDFEGDREKSVEERRRKRSPLRDVARLLRSFHYATEVARADESRVRESDRERLAPWAHAFRYAASVVFLRAYLASAGSAPYVPRDRAQFARLVDVFALSKAVKELTTELRTPGPRLAIPLEAIVEELR